MLGALCILVCVQVMLIVAKDPVRTKVEIAHEHKAGRQSPLPEHMNPQVSPNPIRIDQWNTLRARAFGEGKAASQSSPLRILFLGDELMLGVSPDLSPRLALESVISANGGGGMTTYVGPEMDDLGNRHGVVETEMGLQFAVPELPNAVLGSNEPPDMIVLMLGTLDVMNGRTSEHLYEDLTALLRELRAALLRSQERSGTGVIVVSSLPPLSREWTEPDQGVGGDSNYKMDSPAIKLANQDLKRAVIEAGWDFSSTADDVSAPVLWADIWTMLRLGDDFWDGRLLNHDGAMEVAARWWDVLRHFYAVS